jgi:hypothetical protein
MTTPRLRGGRRLLAVATVAAVGSLAAASSALADVTGVGGGAYAVNASVTGAGAIGLNASAGPLPNITTPTTNTTNSASLLAADLTTIATTGLSVTAGNASSTTSGLPGPSGQVTSSASVASVGGSTALTNALGLADLGFRASAVSSTCTANDSSVSGSTTLVGASASIPGTVGASLDGTYTNTSPTFSVTGSTTVTTLLGSTGATFNLSGTINEQTVTSVPGTNSISVNGVHITGTITTDAITTDLGGVIGIVTILPAQTINVDIVLAHSACTVTGPDVATTTAAQFRSFSARLAKHGVQLNWRTASQIDVLGYNVYRQVHGVKVRINKHLIPARQSGRYSFFDHARRTGARYWLQTVNLDGSRQWHGPARLVAHRLAA